MGIVPIAAAAVLVFANVMDVAMPFTESLERPDLALVVRGLTYPTIAVHNRSATMAQDVDVQLAFWDLDERAVVTGDPSVVFSPSFPGKAVRPGSSVGPWALSAVAGQLSVGHVVFGHASIDCRDCGTRRSYWFSLALGSSGWMKEISRLDAPAMLTRVLLAGPHYRRVLDDMFPAAVRTPIRD